MKVMNSNKFMSAAHALSLALLIALGAMASAQAGPGNGKGKGKPTDPIEGDPDTASIIGDAEVVCNLAVNHEPDVQRDLILTACRLMNNTDGNRDGKGQNCDNEYDPTDPVQYTGRNCNNNEDTLRRDAGSVVTALGDAFITAPAEGDDPCPKLEQAPVYIDSYILTHGELTTVEDGEDKPKLLDGAEPKLGVDANSIQWDIMVTYASEPFNCVDY